MMKTIFTMMTMIMVMMMIKMMTMKTIFIMMTMIMVMMIMMMMIVMITTTSRMCDDGEYDNKIIMIWMTITHNNDINFHLMKTFWMKDFF